MEKSEAEDLISIVSLFHEERMKAYARETHSDVRAAIAVEMSDLEYIRTVIQGHRDASTVQDV